MNTQYIHLQMYNVHLCILGMIIDVSIGHWLTDKRVDLVVDWFIHLFKVYLLIYLRF